MRKLDLDKPLETFAVFDILMAGVFIITFVLGISSLVARPASQGWGIATFVFGMVMLVGDLLIAYGIWIAPRLWSVTNYRIGLIEHPTVWIKTVFIADFHAHKRKPAAWFSGVTKAIKELRPDLMLLGGDYVVWDGSDASHLNPLAELEPQYGTYYVLGNHDYLDDPAAIRERLTSFGWHDITNANLTLRMQGKELGLSGLDEPLFGAPKYTEARAYHVPHLTLAHNPDSVLDLHEGQTDLLLAGHAHGGQLRLPIVGSLFTPNKLGRKADEGEKIINGIHMVVTRGLGEVGVRARFLCRPEIVVLELGI